MKVLRKIISSILLLLVVCGSFTAVACKEEKDVGFSLNETSTTMYVFEDKTLTLTTGSNSKVVWTTTNTDCVTLVPNGKNVTITGLRVGETTIIATQGNNSVSCKLMVFPPKANLTVAINALPSIQLSVDGTYQLNVTAKLDGEQFNNVELEYLLNNASPDGCVTVSDNGLIAAVSQGVAIVSVRAKFADTYSDWASVTVYVFPNDYDNDAEKEPETEDGGFIDDNFGGW